MKRFAYGFLFLVIPAISFLYVFLVVHPQLNSWMIDFLAFGIFPVLVLNFLLLLVSVFYAKNFYYPVLPVLVLFLGLKPLTQTISFCTTDNVNKPDFTVMSYNVATFNSERMNSKENDSLVNTRFYDWLRETGAPDILCLQEFYHSDLSDYTSSLDSILRIGQYKYFYMNPTYKDEHNGVFAVITFSRFRALKSGPLIYNDNYLNKGVYHDFLIREDTVRIVNFQLSSMSIRWEKDTSRSWMQNLVSGVKSTGKKLYEGYHRRNEELDQIEEFLDSSPYKQILCADINAIPQSYTYQRLNRKFGNSFEEAGSGFGFTLNRFPFWVRIDNQFFDRRLQVEYFKTHNELKLSDHFPVEAGYSFR